MSLDPLDIEIRPGFRVRDITSVDECAGIILQLDTDRKNIECQMERHGDDPARPGWRERAIGTLRWKKKTLDTVRLHRQALVMREAVTIPEVIAAPELVDPLDVEFNGVRIADLADSASAKAARLHFENVSVSIVSQIGQHERNPLLFPRGWRTTAQFALSWNKRVLSAVKERQIVLAKVTDRQVVAETRRKLILAVITEDLGEEAVERYARIARHRHPEAFGEDGR